MENYSDEKVEIMQVDTNVIYQQDRAQIDIQISTAKAYPRNIKRATENAVAIATMDLETAYTCGYSLPRGGKPITGPSVHAARIIVQQWGNMRVEAKVIGRDDTTVTSQAIAFDLENNLAVKVEVKRSIMTRTGRMTEDMIVVTGNAANSIAFRNAVFNVVPKSVTDKVYRSAMGLITGDISDKDKLIKKRKKVFDGFIQTYGVNEKEVLSAVGKAAIDHITGDDLVVLIGIGQAIKDGDTTVEDAFKGQKNTTKVTVKEKSEEKENDRIAQFISECKTIEKLEEAEPFIDGDEQLTLLYNQKMDELNAN